MTTKIFTAYDARRQKYAAELQREYQQERRQLVAKIKHWQKQVKLYGGEVQKATLAKFQAQLEAL